jgi:hypothetical protein
LNRANATAFSSLARILLRASGETTLDFQYDVASIAFAEPFIGTHLAVIVRGARRILRSGFDVKLPIAVTLSRRAPRKSWSRH